MALPRRELDRQAATTHDRLPIRSGDLHLAINYGDPRTLVYLVIAKALSRRNLQRDRTSVIGRSQNLRRMRSKVKAPDVPTVHEFALSLREPPHMAESLS
jgi:hypothetical protein